MEPVGDPVEDVRLRVQRTVRSFLTGSPAPPVHPVDREDPGLFGPRSVTWRVHADTAMFIGGLRALLIQTMHPLTMAGVADHSEYKRDPLGRFQRTVHYVGITTYGTTAEANAAIKAVRRVHGRVVGTAPDGRRYAANDPHLLDWVHLTEVESFLNAFQRYAPRPLGPDEADRYVAEMAQLGHLIGAERPPTTVAEMHAAMDRFRPELHVGRQARDAVRFLLVPPFPLVARPAYGIVAGAAVSLLPAWAQRMLWLPVAPGVEPFVVRPAATALMRVLGWALAPQTQSQPLSQTA
jgi:uncharacterized protein (DUF2236 family)